jgi:hypothetical protein
MMITISLKKKILIVRGKMNPVTYCLGVINDILIQLKFDATKQFDIHVLDTPFG